MLCPGWLAIHKVYAYLIVFSVCFPGKMREKLWELGYCDDQVGYLSWVKVGFEF